jgi:NAD(P)H-flavin reductase
MLQAELARRKGQPLSLLFGCRTVADVLWADELARWQREHPRFWLLITLSRPDPTWSGGADYVAASHRRLCRRSEPATSVRFRAVAHG